MFWIGTALLDRLFSYPERRNLSRSSFPIQCSGGAALSSETPYSFIRLSSGLQWGFASSGDLVGVLQQLYLGGSGGFALHGGPGACVVGVSEPRVVQKPPFGAGIFRRDRESPC